MGDIDTGTVYLPSSNGYAFPYSDQLAITFANGRYEDNVQNYSDTMAAAYRAHEAGSASLAFQLSSDAISNLKDCEMRRRATRTTRSPRYQRFFHDSVIAIHAYSGTLQWAYPILGHDQRDNGWTLSSPLSVYQENGNNHDILSVAVVVTVGRKRLLAAGKMAVGLYDLDKGIFSFIAARAQDEDARHGLTDMQVPELRVDMFMKTGLASFGGFVVHDGNYYIMRVLAGTDIGPSILPKLPAGGDSPLVPISDMPLIIWSRNIESGDIHWIGVIEAGNHMRSSPNLLGLHTGGLVGYGNVLVVGDVGGRFHVIDMRSGVLRALLPTLSAAQAGSPVVNGHMFHMGGPAKWGGKGSFAYYVEMFSPQGV